LLQWRPWSATMRGSGVTSQPTRQRSCLLLLLFFSSAEWTSQ
jgi:hypothetical protein